MTNLAIPCVAYKIKKNKLSELNCQPTNTILLPEVVLNQKACGLNQSLADFKWDKPFLLRLCFPNKNHVTTSKRVFSIKDGSFHDL